MNQACWSTLLGLAVPMKVWRFRCFGKSPLENEFLSDPDDLLGIPLFALTLR